MILVQDAVVPQKNMWKEYGKLKPLLKALNINWSGHPELSDGKVPDALLRFINCRRRKVFGSVKLMKGLMVPNSAVDIYKHINIGYLVRERQEDWLKHQLEAWQFERPKLVIPVYPANPKSMMFCIDPDFECFFWTASNGRELLEQTLPVSAKTFRENRRQIRVTIDSLADILNEGSAPVEDRFTRMERDEES